MIVFAIMGGLIALIPVAMVMANRRLFLPPAEFPGTQPEPISTPLSPGSDIASKPRVSVLIPARDEASSIAACLQSTLASENVDLEVIVLDDASTDRTAEIVREIATRDARVRLIHGAPLPSDWNGKQHACWQLAKASSSDYLLFIDADVRLTSDALRRLIHQKEISKVALLSAFPAQETFTFWEKLLIPMMHFVLLGFLPIRRMRDKVDPSLAAGCGQLFLTTQSEYQQAGTHEAIRQSRHDGLKLPRAYRSAGLMTDICDGSTIARCRMYHNGPQVFRGLLKNASEGIANPRLIVPFTVLLIGGGVLPVAVFITCVASIFWTIETRTLEPATPGSPGMASSQIAATDGWLLAISAVSCFLAWFPRLWTAGRFRQSWLGALLHPISMIAFVVIQWVALGNQIRGKQIAWRGRTET